MLFSVGVLLWLLRVAAVVRIKKGGFLTDSVRFSRICESGMPSTPNNRQSSMSWPAFSPAPSRPPAWRAAPSARTADGDARRTYGGPLRGAAPRVRQRRPSCIAGAGASARGVVSWVSDLNTFRGRAVRFSQVRNFEMDNG